MFWLREALAAHSVLLALLYGQAFFVLGLSIILLARQSARLEIACGLAPLTIFGFCEALIAWSPVWLASSSAPPPWLSWLWLLILGAGHTSLLAFALQAYVPPEKRQWTQWTFAGGLLTLWLIALSVARVAGASLERTQLFGEIFARYFLVLPGSLIGAWGLYRQAYCTISPERLPLIKPHLRVAGLALGCFAMFGGLLGPAAPFFPANRLNQEMFLQVTGIPLALLRGLCGIVITYGIARALEAVLNEAELWLESVEHMQALARERERIGRELHDGIIQSIYAAGLMLEGAQHSIPNEPEAAQAQLARAIGSLNQTIQDIRRYIFDLRGEMLHDDLETGLSKMLKDFRVNTLLQAEFVVEGENTRPLGAERRQHIFQIAREALTNVARHAKARQVKVRLRYGVNALQLRISDDGIGLSALPVHRGQGLRNIRERARLLDGMLDVDTAPNKGMTLILTVPY
jgi:signal transduction histidine kinase